MNKDTRFSEDTQAIQAFLQGNNQAFAWLVSKYRIHLFRLGVKMTRNFPLVEDAVQDTFIKAYQKLSGFEGRSSFKSWLYTIFLNTLRNHLRGKEHDTLESHHLSQGDSGGEQVFYRKQIAEKIELTIAQLPERQKLAVTLRIYEELPFEEIAQIMQCPYDTAKANFRHGILKVKQALLDLQIDGSDIAHQSLVPESLGRLWLDERV